MAYFNLASETTTAMTFGGTSLTCLQSIELTATAPPTEIECGGATSVNYVVGIPRYSMTVTGALDDEDDPLLNAVLPNTAGAITCDPAGTTATHIDISSTNATVSDLSSSFPVNGFASYSITFLLDDITIGANV